MNCNEFKEQWVDLFDESASRNTRENLLDHLEACPQCTAEYLHVLKTINAASPRVGIHASSSLKNNILNQIMMKEKDNSGGKSGRIPMFSRNRKRAISIAAVILILFALIPLLNPNGWFDGEAKAAGNILDKAIAAMTDISSVHMKFQVRTEPNDNFDYIDTRADFVDHSLWKTYGDTPQWRIEKPGRIVVFDGKKQYLYMKSTGNAFRGSADAGFINWMKIYLDPLKIMETEKKSSEINKADYKLMENETTVKLIVNAKAMGDFRNTYSLNKSVPESNNRREYTFDKVTGRLLSAEVYVISNKQEVKVIDITSIEYNKPIDAALFTINLPEGIAWTELDVGNRQVKFASPKITINSAEDAAKLFFTACSKYDWDIVEKLFPSLATAGNAKEIKDYIGGLKLISLGKPFKSGLFGGTFVPYEVKFKSGETKKMNLAVRNDNTEHVWLVDGGF